MKITPVASSGAILKKYFNKHSKFTKYVKEVIILLDLEGKNCVKASKLASQLKEMLGERESQAASAIVVQNGEKKKKEGERESESATVVQNGKKKKKDKKGKTSTTQNHRTTRSTSKSYQLRSKNR